MNVVFLSNFFNIHQVPLSNALYSELNADFTFIATTEMDNDRKIMGFKIKEPPFVINAFESKELKSKALELISSADVVIWGSASYEYISQRLKDRKLIFKYSERYFKGENHVINRVRFLISAIKHIRPLKNKNIYFLCASAYTSQDINRFSDFRNRALKWGYFREIEKLNILDLPKKANSLLWVGRMIDWKQPHIAVNLAENLKKKGYNFELNMVGDGECLSTIHELIVQKNLSDCVHLLGSKTPKEVSLLMRESMLFVGTSNFKEGWGVVVNEAMNYGCAVVVSHSTGSAPYLIENGVNGIIYPNNDEDALLREVCMLLDNPSKAMELGSMAYNTLTEIWNASLAVQRLLGVCNSVINEGKINFYENGPCSPAEILSNNWIYEVKNS